MTPPDGPPTLGFPVDDDGDPVVGRELPGGEQDCTVRLLVTPDRRGDLAAGSVQVTYSSGPRGLLRRTASVRPDVTLEVTGTGPDPRRTAP